MPGTGSGQSAWRPAASRRSGRGRDGRTSRYVCRRLQLPRPHGRDSGPRRAGFARSALRSNRELRSGEDRRRAALARARALEHNVPATPGRVPRRAHRDHELRACERWRAGSRPARRAHSRSRATRDADGAARSGGARRSGLELSESGAGRSLEPRCDCQRDRRRSGACRQHALERGGPRLDRRLAPCSIGQMYRWQIRGVSFDEAFRNAMAGAAQILSGHGLPR
jgi:hypothetical protein